MFFRPIIRVISIITLIAFLPTQVAWGYEDGVLPNTAQKSHLRSEQPKQADGIGKEIVTAMAGGAVIVAPPRAAAADVTTAVASEAEISEQPEKSFPGVGVEENSAEHLVIIDGKIKASLQMGKAVTDSVVPIYMADDGTLVFTYSNLMEIVLFPTAKVARSKEIYRIETFLGLCEGRKVEFFGLSESARDEFISRLASLRRVTGFDKLKVLLIFYAENVIGGKVINKDYLTSESAKFREKLYERLTGKPSRDEQVKGAVAKTANVLPIESADISRRLGSLRRSAELNEEDELFLVRICQQADEGFKNAALEILLSKKYRKYIRSIASRYGWSLTGMIIDARDLERAGYDGFCKAVERFDFERGNKFITYATPCIRGEIEHMIRDARDAPDWLQRVENRINKAQELLGLNATLAALANYLKINEEQLGILLLAIHRTSPAVSLNSGFNNDEYSKENLPVLNDNALITPDFALQLTDRIFLNDLITASDLTAKESAVIRLYFIDQLSQVEIAGRLEISVDYVGLILDVVIRRLMYVNSKHSTDLTAQPIEPNSIFTSREMDIIRLIWEGKSNEEIAVSLGLKINKVTYVLMSIFRIIGCNNRIGLCVEALKSGLIKEGRSVEEGSLLVRLTDIEIKILNLKLQGKNNRMVADDLRVADTIIGRNFNKLCEKCGANDGIGVLRKLVRGEIIIFNQSDERLEFDLLSGREPLSVRDRQPSENAAAIAARAAANGQEEKGSGTFFSKGRKKTSDRQAALTEFTGADIDELTRQIKPISYRLWATMIDASADFVKPIGQLLGAPLSRHSLPTLKAAVYPRLPGIAQGNLQFGGYVNFLAGFVKGVPKEKAVDILAWIIAHESGHLICDTICPKSDVDYLDSITQWLCYFEIYPDAEKTLRNRMMAEEYFADGWGIFLAHRAGFDIYGYRDALAYCEKFINDDSFAGDRLNLIDSPLERQVGQLLKTHPDYKNRLARMDELAPDLLAAASPKEAVKILIKKYQSITSPIREENLTNGGTAGAIGRAAANGSNLTNLKKGSGTFSPSAANSIGHFNHASIKNPVIKQQLKDMVLEEIKLSGAATAEEIYKGIRELLGDIPEQRHGVDFFQDSLRILLIELEDEESIEVIKTPSKHDPALLLDTYILARPVQSLSGAPAMFFLDEGVKKIKSFISQARKQGKSLLLILDLDKSLSIDSASPISEDMARCLTRAVNAGDVYIAVLTMRKQQEIDSRVLSILAKFGIDQGLEDRIISLPYSGRDCLFPKKRFSPFERDYFEKAAEEVLGQNGIKLDLATIKKDDFEVPPGENFLWITGKRVSCVLRRTILKERKDDIRPAIIRALRQEGIIASKSGRATIESFPVTKGDAVFKLVKDMIRKKKRVAVIGVDDGYVKLDVGRTLLIQVASLSGLALTFDNRPEAEIDKTQIPKGANLIKGVNGPDVCLAVLQACAKTTARAAGIEASALPETISGVNPDENGYGSARAAANGEILDKVMEDIVILTGNGDVEAKLKLRDVDITDRFNYALALEVGRYLLEKGYIVDNMWWYPNYCPDAAIAPNVMTEITLDISDRFRSALDESLMRLDKSVAADYNGRMQSSVTTLLSYDFSGQIRKYSKEDNEGMCIIKRGKLIEPEKIAKNRPVGEKPKFADAESRIQIRSAVNDEKEVMLEDGTLIIFEADGKVKAFINRSDGGLKTLKDILIELANANYVDEELRRRVVLALDRISVDGVAGDSAGAADVKAASAGKQAVGKSILLVTKAKGYVEKGIIQGMLEELKSKELVSEIVSYEINEASLGEGGELEKLSQAALQYDRVIVYMVDDPALLNAVRLNLENVLGDLQNIVDLTDIPQEQWQFAIEHSV